MTTDAVAFLLEEIKQGVKRGAYFPLLPRHNVYLFAPLPETGGERFARLFIETWKRIPLGPRRRILKHWKSGDSFAVGMVLETVP